MSKSIQETLNELSRISAEAELAIEANRLKMVEIEGADKSEEEKATILIKSNLEEAFTLRTKMNVLYEATLKTLDEKGVIWEEIIFHLQTVVFKGSYPLKENGKPLGLTEARKTVESARIINNFNSYRLSKYSNYGVEKPKVKKDVRPPKSDVEVETDKAVDDFEPKNGENTEVQKPVAFDRNLIPAFLIEMHKMYTELDNLEAIKAIEILAELEKVEVL